MNKKGWKRLKKVVQQAFVCCKHPKAGRNTQHKTFQSKLQLFVKYFFLYSKAVSKSYWSPTTYLEPLEALSWTNSNKEIKKSFKGAIWYRIIVTEPVNLKWSKTRCLSLNMSMCVMPLIRCTNLNKKLYNNKRLIILKQIFWCFYDNDDI